VFSSLPVSRRAGYVQGRLATSCAAGIPCRITSCSPPRWETCWQPCRTPPDGPYGLDAVTAWPRLYPVLGEQCRTLVDDRRDTLDASVRLAATMAVTALASLVLLLGDRLVDRAGPHPVLLQYSTQGAELRFVVAGRVGHARVSCLSVCCT
jgi:hypothetical protein